MSSRPRAVYSRKQLAERVAWLGRVISRDYRGRTVQVVPILENSVVFAADLLRHITAPVICSFVHVGMRDVSLGGYERREVFFSPEPNLNGRDVLVVDTVLQSGVTMDFLLRRLQQRQPRSLRLAVLLDKSDDRKVDVQADYVGFRAASNYWVGYGLSDPSGLYRNLPYLGVVGRSPVRKTRAPAWHRRTRKTAR